MSTLVLSTAANIGANIGTNLGSTLVNTAGQFAMATASRAITHALDTRNFEGPKLQSFHLLTSQDGAPMARIYGRVRLAGQVIWASRLKENASTSSVGKGGPTQTEYSYTISFAIGLCEGVIQGVDRLWINGQAVQTAGLNFRVYNGTEDQFVDPKISAVEGAFAPAFRGTAYMVFEDFALDEYGGRLPLVNAEVVRVPPASITGPQMETLVTGVNLLPSSGEYAYATDVIEDITGPGAAVPINMNNLSGQADINLALDQLETGLPNCKSVAIIISWFGTDIRVGSCEIRPGVESRERLVDWQVCGDTRSTAHLVSQDSEGRPFYGGTPTDASIIQAIGALKLRGYSVMIYPFILMDIPSSNGLPDPYGGAEQATFPWRGRITSFNDGGTLVTGEVAHFFGTCQASDFRQSGQAVDYNGPDEYSFRRFILHHAKLAQIAGGVDKFVIGSEMHGLTTLQSGIGQYPSVSQLKSLAAEVRALVGPNTGLTYAADWSEYFGHHTGGNVFYHLDDLWADPNIDAVGIDAYMPLSDWRDGAHLDEQVTDSIYDLSYLKSNMEGGEGYDWYYANDADRAVQNRIPITDGAYNKPWVYRYKDLRNWWLNPHYNRVNGVETNDPTPWIAQSKPFWLTEIGCPAVNKGANQPNVFVDPKSAESFAPYFSSGARDDLIQRRYIEAFVTYWADNTPISAVYNAPMIDPDAIHVWCWDARPYPDFPSRDTVWSDGPNWQIGHWLCGRTGVVPLRDVVSDIITESGAALFDTSKTVGMVSGYMIERPMSARAALEPLSFVYGFHVSEQSEGLSVVSTGSEASKLLTDDDLVALPFSAVEEHFTDPNRQPRDVRIQFIDSAQDYQPGSVSARNLLAETVRVIDISAPVVIDQSMAQTLAERILNVSAEESKTVNFQIAPSVMDVEVGDTVILPGHDGQWKITEMDGFGVQTVSAQSRTAITTPILSGVATPTAVTPTWIAKPVPFALDIPNFNGLDRNGLLVGGKLDPYQSMTIDGAGQTVNTNGALYTGALLTPLSAGPVGYWDRANGFDLFMPDIALASVSDDDVLSGANLFGVQTSTGWEIIQAASITLIDNNTWQVRDLLRGLFGTDVDMDSVISTGATVVWLGSGLSTLPVPSEYLGEPISLVATASTRTSDAVPLVYEARDLRPLSPVHLKYTISGGGFAMTWVRRTRSGGDLWTGLDVSLGEEREFYEIAFLSGEAVLQTFETTLPALSVNSAAYAALNAPDAVRVRQGSVAYGWGASAVLGL